MSKKRLLIAVGGLALAGLVYEQSHIFSDNEKLSVAGLSANSAENSSQKQFSENSFAVDSGKEADSERMAAQYLKYQSLFNVRQEFRDFFESAHELDDNTKKEKIEKLEEKLVLLETEKKASRVEALLLHLALLKFDPDSENAKRRGKALVAEYQRLADARNKAFIENPEPKFVNYKQKEKQVLSEVLAMETYPDGLTRDQYLARRLAEVRTQVYTNRQDNLDSATDSQF